VSINPAYAGRRDALSFTLLNRRQWVDFDGAPVTYSFTANSPIGNGRHNMGLSFTGEDVGPLTTNAFFIDYAYRVSLTWNSKLSFGLKLGFNEIEANLTSLALESDFPDAAFQTDINHIFAPNLGFGAMYSTDHFYFGLSTPKLLINNYEVNGDSLYLEQRHYYMITGGMLPLSLSWDFLPAVYLKMTKGAVVQADFSARFSYHKNYTLGAMYRTGDAFGLLVGAQVMRNMYVGYSYDWSIANTTGKYNNGTHEMVLQYEINLERNKRIRSPRYF